MARFFGLVGARAVLFLLLVFVAVRRHNFILNQTGGILGVEEHNVRAFGVRLFGALLVALVVVAPHATNEGVENVLSHGV